MNIRHGERRAVTQKMVPSPAMSGWPARRCILAVPLFFALAACTDYVPREKTVSFDPATGELALPYPCPDWSHNAVRNYDNSVHSNFGCATNSNLAVQLERPRDLNRGHGDHAPDTGITTSVIEAYRAGEIPAPLSPQQDVADQ